MAARGAPWGVDLAHRQSTLPKRAAPGSNPAPKGRSAGRLRNGRPVSSQTAEVAAVRDGKVTFRLEDGRMLDLAPGDP